VLTDVLGSHPHLIFPLKLLLCADISISSELAQEAAIFNRELFSPPLLIIAPIYQLCALIHQSDQGLLKVLTVPAHKGFIHRGEGLLDLSVDY